MILLSSMVQKANFFIFLTLLCVGPPVRISAVTYFKTLISTFFYRKTGLLISLFFTLIPSISVWVDSKDIPGTGRLYLGWEVGILWNVQIETIEAIGSQLRDILRLCDPSHLWTAFSRLRRQLQAVIILVKIILKFV